MVGVALSLVVAVTQVPMLSSVLLVNKHAGGNGNGATHAGGNGARRRSPYARFSAGFDARYERFAGWYTRVLGLAIDRPGLVATIALALFVGTLVMVKLGAVQSELFPPSNSRYARFSMQMPTGTAVSGTNAVLADIEGRMLKDPRVDNVGVLVGSTSVIGGTNITNQANMSVTLKPGIAGAKAAAFVNEWTAALTGTNASHKAASLAPEKVAALRERYGNPIPGLQVYGRTVDIVQNTIARGQDALQIQVFGKDVGELYNIAEFDAIPALQAAIPGLQPPQPGYTNSQPEIDVNVDRTLAAQLGIDTNTISQDIDIATAGEIASYMQINGTQYPIEVQLPPDQRRSLASIESLTVPVSTVPTGLIVNS
jgi:multidrug efflux pump subunit AcrB